MNTNEASEKPKNRNIINNVVSFLKSHKRLTFMAIIILAVIVIAITVVTILHADQAEKIARAQIGKCYIETYTWGSEPITEIHYFTETGVANLYVHYYKNQNVSYVTGSLNEVDRDYSFRISLFGTPFLDYTSSSTPVKLNENNEIIEYFHPWKLISLEKALAFEEEIYNLYARNDCEHQYGTTEIIKEATCTSRGESKQICKKCGYEQFSETLQLPHDYVNKVCSVCGAEKRPEKSDIEPDTWYLSEDVLYIQNCLVSSAVSVGQGRGMMVQYRAVCQHCHAVDEYSKLAGPEVGYPVEKIYTCEYCGGKTMIKFKID